MRKLYLIISGLSLFALASCSQVTNAIDNFFTFNYEKTVDLPFPASAPVGQILTNDLPISVDSASLASNGTSLSLLKSAELNKLAFTFSDPTYIMKQSVDTIILSVTNDSLGTQTIATYSKTLDSMQYTNANIVSFIKSPLTKFNVTFRLLADPKMDILAHCDYVIVFTASPF